MPDTAWLSANVSRLKVAELDSIIDQLTGAGWITSRPSDSVAKRKASETSDDPFGLPPLDDTPTQEQIDAANAAAEAAAREEAARHTA